MLKNLQDMKVSAKMFSNQSNLNHIDSNYNKLCNKIEPLD